MLQISTISNTNEQDHISVQCAETDMAGVITKKERKKKKKKSKWERDNAVSKSLAHMKHPNKI